jgi:carbamoyltransferase
MYILGISALYHNSSAALFKDGELLYASEEERFSRVKFDSIFPVKSIRFCLEEAGITKKDISKIVYYEDPYLKVERQIEMYQDIIKIPFMSLKAKLLAPEAKIYDYFGSQIKLEIVNHHLSHAANAQFYFGDIESAHLVADAVGEKSSMWMGKYKNGKFEQISEVHFPHSLGMLYSTFTDFLGFRVNADEYKLMGLAAYGKPKYQDLILKTIKTYEKDKFELNLEYFCFQNLPGNSNYTPMFSELFKDIPPPIDKNFKQEHMDLAASIQAVTELILLEKIKFLKDKTQSKNLCLSGGVALNCLANMKIENSKIFNNIFIPPNPGDAGSSIGCVAYTLLRDRIKTIKPLHSFYGQKSHSLDPAYLEYETQNIEDKIGFLAKKIHEGNVIAIYQGRSEFGPRALGNRSIIANATIKDMKDILNKKVKQRESYRPFAPIMRTENVNSYFEIDHHVPYMTKTYKVIETMAKNVPSVVHEDGTARLQTINSENRLLYNLLTKCKEQFDIPILINTSFNLSDEPIVNTPLDAYICFLRCDIDILYLDGVIIEKKNINKYQINNAKRIFKDKTRELDRNSYTF